MGNVIVMQKDDVIEVWGSITRISLKHKDFKYGYLKHLKFPFTYKGWRFIKTKYLK